MADAGDEVVFRRVNRNDLERRSRPDSAHKGNLKRLKTSSVGGFQRWEKENELLWAMLEDETEWLAKLFPDIIITPELFFYALEDGVVLCRLANRIQEAAEEYARKNKTRFLGKKFKFHTSIPKKNKHLALFKSRENVQGFLTWCRQIGISDSILFESNDVVEADECREGCREVVICLMEIARRASAACKFSPIPKLIQLEQEIEIEEQKEAEENSQDQVDYASSDEESNRSCPSPEAHSPPTDDGSTHCPPDANNKKKRKRHQPKSELDKEVFKIIDNFNVYNIRKIKEGKYMILGKIIFVRMLNGHILLRIGGGWDTLEHYLLTHLPKVASENGHCSTEAAVSPSVAKTPQKSQITKILDKVKKEQQLKATPSPYRTAGRSGSKSDNEDDEKDITSAIRKIEFSVNQNIATRRKVSKHSVEETPQKSPSSAEETGSNTPSDINQNSLTEKVSKSRRRKSKNMESEANVFHGHNGDVFNPEQQNGEVTNFEDSLVKEGNVESLSEVKETTDNGTDVTDGAVFGKFNPESATGTNETEQEESKEVDFEFQADTIGPSVDEQSSNQDEICLENSEEHSTEQCPPPEDVLPNESPKNENEDSEASASVAEGEILEVPSNDADVPPVIPEGTKTSESPSPETTGSESTTPDAPQSPQKSPSPSGKKDGAEAPKKKTAVKTSKDPTKTKPAATKTPGKKEPGSTAGGRPKSAKPSARANATDTSTGKNTKRPTSAAVKTSTTTAARSSATTAAKSSTTSAAKTKTTVAGKPSATAPKAKVPPSQKPTTTTTSSSGRASPTKKPASKPADPKPTRPAKTTAFGSTVSSGPTKTPAAKTRPATAPPSRTTSTQAKKKPVAAKVQSWSSSAARPQSAKPSTKSKEAIDGGAASKETGDNRPTSPTKPLVRKTQTRTVTTTKTTRVGASGAPETKSQTLKTTRTVTEANGKKTTKTTVKEISPTGRKPLRMTTETTEGGAASKKPTKAVADSKTGTRTAKAAGTKKPETKTGAKTGTSRTKKETGTKKTPTKTAPKGKELKGGINEVPKAKTVKELSNALGIAKTSDKKEKNDKKIETEPKEKEVEEPTAETPELAPAKIEESPQVEESVKVEETAKIEETPEVEQSVKVDEFVPVDESVEVRESVEIEQSVEFEASVKVEEHAKVESPEDEQPVKEEEFVPIDDEPVKAEESVEVEQSVEESAQVDESVEVDESRQVEEPVKAEESRQVHETAEVEEPSLVDDESFKVEEKPQVDESGKAEEFRQEAENVKEEEFVQVDEFARVEVSPEAEVSAPACEEAPEGGEDGEFARVGVSPEPEVVAPVCEETPKGSEDGEAEVVNVENEEMVPQGLAVEEVIQGTEEGGVQSVDNDVVLTTDELHPQHAVEEETANDVELAINDDAFDSTEKTAENVIIDDSLEENRDPPEALGQDTREFQGTSEVIVPDSPEPRDRSEIVDESLDEDSLDVIVVPESDVSQDENTLQSTEAWSVVSDEKEHLQDVDLIGDNNNAIEETGPKLDPYLFSSDADPEAPPDTAADQNLFDISGDGKTGPWFSEDSGITSEPINRDSGFQENSTVDDLLG